MVGTMKRVVHMDVELTEKERNLLSIAYKNSVATRRASWRIVSSLLQIDLNKEQQNITKEYQSKIERELTIICNDILELLDNYLITSTEEIQTKVFYIKMKADYNRYIAEFTTNELKEKAIKNSKEAYEEAIEIAKGLEKLNLNRLSLILNYCVFIFEILDDYEKSRDIAKKEFDAAIDELDLINHDETLFRDVTSVLALIRDFTR